MREGSLQGPVHTWVNKTLAKVQQHPPSLLEDRLRGQDPQAWAPQRLTAAASLLSNPNKVILSVSCTTSRRNNSSSRAEAARVRRRHTRRGQARRGWPPRCGTRSLSDKVAGACVSVRRGATADTTGWANTEPSAADTRLNMTRLPPLVFVRLA